ncbi:MAG TPA: hypothetical protein VJV22_17715 [Acidobacteriaceae bacterium]|nr:hypothetical protein [Acidobacteriaceae bacterium]
MSRENGRNGRRRHFTPEEKATILRRHLADKVSVWDLCDEYHSVSGPLCGQLNTCCRTTHGGRDGRIRPLQDMEGGRRVQLADEIRNDIRAAKKLRLPWWGVLLAIFAGTLGAWLFDRFGRLDLELPSLDCIIALGVVLIVKRKLWRHVWFWITMGIIAALHVALLLLIPWTTKWVPAVAIAAMVGLDITAVIAIVDFVGQFTGGPENRL